MRFRAGSDGAGTREHGERIDRIEPATDAELVHQVHDQDAPKIETLMSVQQAVNVGAQGILSPDHFTQLFTTHGTVMIFFVGTPLQIESPDVAFPFLTSMSLWLTIGGGGMMMSLSSLVSFHRRLEWLSTLYRADLQWRCRPRLLDLGRDDQFTPQCDNRD